MKTLLFTLAVLAGLLLAVLPADAQDARRAIIQAADGMVGLKEKTGRNDGVAIDAILASVGLAGTGAPYCAAFVVKCGDDALGRKANPFPRSAWSPDMVVRPTWLRGKGREPQAADAFGIYFPRKGRVAHTGLIRRNLGNVLETVEGNTSGEAVAGSAADREGQGVFRKRRLKAQIYAVRDWISAP